jgi:hypothetical protein
MEVRRRDCERRIREREANVRVEAEAWERGLTPEAIKKYEQSGLLLHLPLDEAKGDAKERLPFSTLPDPPVSLEGIVIAIAFAALLAWHVYQALEPHLVSRTPGP